MVGAISSTSCLPSSSEKYLRLAVSLPLLIHIVLLCRKELINRETKSHVINEWPCSAFPNSSNKMAVHSILRPSLFQIIFVLLILRSRIITLPKEFLERCRSKHCFLLIRFWSSSRIRDVTTGKRLSAVELISILQQVYVKEPDGSKTLLLTYRNRLQTVCNISISRADSNVIEIGSNTWYGPSRT